MKTLITLSALLALTLTVAAQPPDTLWTRTFGGGSREIGYSVQQTSDGGYIIAGETWSYGAGSADVYLIKTDELGYINWTRTFGGLGGDYGQSVQQTTDGGYVIAGYTYSYGAGSDDIYLIKTDTAGNLVWQRTFGGSNGEKGYSVQQTSDGGYVIVGYTVPYGASQTDVFLVKTDERGDINWTRTFGGNTPDCGNSVQQTTDGGYIIAGQKESVTGFDDVYLIKTNALGYLVWQHTFGGSSGDAGNSVLQTSDGGYVIAGYTYSYSVDNANVYLIKTDAYGNLIWQSTFGGGGSDCGESVQQTSDRGYVVVGTSNYSNNSTDVYLIKATAVGNLLWQCTLGWNFHDDGYSVQQTSEGGYVIAGYTGPGGYYDRNIYLIKTDAGEGEIMDIDTSPINSPIVIPRNGGNFHYYINVHNLTSQPHTFSIWNKVRDQFNAYFNVFGPVTRTLPGAILASRILNQTISGNIPGGVLTFISYVGTYPDTILDSSSFMITKVIIGDGGPWISESYVTGDCFDEYAGANVGAQHAAPLPAKLTILGISPNPFNPSAMLTFTLPHPARVSLEVFDINGRLVGQPSVVASAGGKQGRLPYQEIYEAGTHTIPFDGTGLPSGIYLARLTAGEYTAVQKMVLLK